MLKYVPVQNIEDDESFPYDCTNWAYSDDLLRSSLYCPWWTEIDDENGTESVLLMDYDGFVEWYNSNIDDWMKDDDEIDWENYPAEEYLPYHLGRTLTVVKEVR